jgi:hypothetical protein
VPDGVSEELEDALTEGDTLSDFEGPSVIESIRDWVGCGETEGERDSEVVALLLTLTSALRDTEIE